MLNKFREVVIYGEHLKNKKIAFVVTGRVNAYKVPEFVSELRKYSCEVCIYATEDGLKYVTPEILKWASSNDVCLI